MWGAVNSLGNNILGTNNSETTGFSAGTNDLIGVTPAALKLGPLLYSGGTTRTGHTAGRQRPSTPAASHCLRIKTTSASPTTSAVQASLRTNTTVNGNNNPDIGAFEVQPPPTLTSLVPNTDAEGNGPLSLTINGTNLTFVSQVNFGPYLFNGSSIDVTATQITLTIPVADLYPSSGTTYNVTVSQPDGSGITGRVDHIEHIAFSFTAPATVPLNLQASNKIR